MSRVVTTHIRQEQVVQAGVRGRQGPPGPGGDAVLRQDLSNPDKGAALVAYGEGTVADKLDEIVRGAVTKPIVDAKVLAHNQDPAAHPELQVNTSNIMDGAVTPDKTSFIGPSLNLFDPDDVEDFLIIGQDGTPTASENYKTTGFIPVEPSTDYTWYGNHPTFSPFTYIAQYNSSRQFISRLGLTTVNKQTTRFDTAFVRLMFPRAVDVDRMFAKGSVPPTKFVPFTKTLRGVALSPDAVHDIKVGADAPMLDVAGDLFYSTDDDFADVAGFNTLSTADVHALWDALASDYPDYIAKTDLGDDAFGNPIALYSLSPPRPVTPFNDLLRPKIFLISGIHGGEDVSGFGTYVLANRLCNAWSSSEALEMLRFNVELLVIPVANPSGWNARTRKNGNGVDLNRNFPDGWVESDPADVTYGGPSPLSELEAQYISQVMQENPDIDMFCDFHNFGAGGGIGGSGNSFVWVSSVPGRYVPHLAQIMMQRLTRKWRTEYDWIPDDPAWFAGYASVSTGGMAKMHALETYGVELSTTFEVCNVWGLQPGTPMYSPEQKRSTIEALVNWLVLNVKEVVRRG